MSADTNPTSPDEVAGNYTDNAADPTVNPLALPGQSTTSNYLSDSAMALENPANNDSG